MGATQSDVDAAIAARDAIIQRGAASYTVEGITYTALDLDKLERVIDRMRREVATIAGRHASVAEFGRPD